MVKKTKLLTKESTEATTPVPVSRTACLVHIYPTGPDLGKRYTLTEDAILTVGRQEGCDIHIDDNSVSRRHAIVQAEADGFYATDLGSTNGTFVNNEKITRCKLKDGDHLGVGTCIYHFLTGSNIESAYHEEIYRLAIVDALTDVYNKRYFLEHLERALASANRNHRPLVLVMFDIDHFKAINDDMGHLAGDYALRELALSIKSSIRKQDLLARYGGEEFALVLPETTHKDALGMAERLRRQVEKQVFQYDNKSFTVTISLGVRGTTGDEALDLAEFIKQADENLYQAKHQGRNRVVG